MPARRVVVACLLLTGVVAASVAFVHSGVYDVGADTHIRDGEPLLDTLRERSIAARVRGLSMPDVTDEARIRQGAGNYAVLCARCHLSPGGPPTELSRGLNPAPPDLSRHEVDALTAFWVIKHGIKASGMPAFGRSIDDDRIWNMAAFLQYLPRMTAAEYLALVAADRQASPTPPVAPASTSATGRARPHAARRQPARPTAAPAPGAQP